MNPLGVFAPVSAVFPALGNDLDTFRSILSRLSLTDTILFCARLNLFVSNPLNQNHKAKQQDMLNILFSAEEIDRLNLFAKEEGGADRVTVFFRGQLLEMIRWTSLLCRDLPGDGRTFEDAANRQTLAKALLIASDLWGRRVYGGKFSLDGGIDVARLRGLGPIREAIAETSLGLEPLVALGHGKLIFSDYFPRFYRDFAAEFIAKTGLSIDEYYLCMCTLMGQFLATIPEETNFFKKTSIFDINQVYQNIPTNMVTAFSKYFQLHAQTIEELRASLWGNTIPQNARETEPFTLKPLRQRPIVRTGDGRATVLDSVLYGDAAMVGPLFLLTANRSNQIFGYFGDAIEAYTGDIFARMYPDSGSYLAKRFVADFKGRDTKGHEIQISDACLNDVTDAAIFETKAVWVKDTVILNDAPNRYLDHLREKYGVVPKSGERAKGIGQLATAVTNLASQTWAPRDVDFQNVRTIYPILLVYDSFLDSPVHCQFLNSEFKHALTPDAVLQNEMMRKGQFLVAPLIIMTLEHLEALETGVTHMRLMDLFRDYTTACPDRLTSFHNFIATSPKYKKTMYYNSSIAAKTLEVLKDSVRKIGLK